MRKQTELAIWGFAVLVKGPDGNWSVKSDADYPDIPEHHELIECAEDAVEHLRKHGVNARLAGICLNADEIEAVTTNGEEEE